MKLQHLFEEGRRLPATCYAWTVSGMFVAFALGAGCSNQSACEDGNCDGGVTDEDDSATDDSDIDSTDSENQTSSDDSEIGDSDTAEEPKDTELPPEGCVIYVDAAAGSDGRSGESWQEAKAGIQPALTAAEALGCTEVWAAAGLYRSAEPGGSVVLVDGIDVYGGFSGSETERTERDAFKNVTNIDRITGADDVILDGFRIEDNSSRNPSLIIEGKRMTIQSCRFNDNRTAVEATDSTVTIQDCLFSGNNAGIIAHGGEILVIDTEIKNTETSDDVATWFESGGSLSVYENTTLNIENTRIEGSENRALRARSATVNINGCVFDGHRTHSWVDLGTAIDAESSAVVITDTSFTNNGSPYDGWYGGAISSVDGSITIEDCVFEDNAIDVSEDGGHGGCVSSVGSTMSIARTDFISNRGYWGGAIYSEDSDIQISDCLFENNLVGSGCIFVAGGETAVASISGSSFIGNVANGSGGGQTGHESGLTHNNQFSLKNNNGTRKRGALSQSKTGTMKIESSIFSENSGEYAAAVNSNGIIDISNCLFEKNTASIGAIATNHGEALFVGNLGFQDGTSSISDCRIIDTHGGAITITGDVTMTNVLINGNDNNAVHLVDGDAVLSNVTITGNSDETGTGQFGAAFYKEGGTLSIANSNIYNNPCGEIDDTPALEGVAVTYTNLDVDFEGEGNISADPLFVAAPVATTMANYSSSESSVILDRYTGQLLDGTIIEIGNDGVPRTITRIVNSEVFFEPIYPVETGNMRVDIWGTSATTMDTDFHLQENSPCIDTGTEAQVVATKDLDGNPRISGVTVDMGAYEFQWPEQ